MSMSILVDPNLVRNFFGNNFLILFMVRTLENNYFLLRTKLEYLRYNTWMRFKFYNSTLNWVRNLFILFSCYKRVFSNT